jgi:hypothetical protein
LQWIKPLMKKEILEERLKELDWSAYKLAQEFARLREQEEGVEKKVTSFVTSVRQALDKPEKSSLKTIETIIKALDGELVIRWKQKAEVVTGEKEVIVD